jgi:hypothetical protein
VACSGTMCLMFAIAVYLHHKHVAHSTVSHTLVHFFGNMATIISILGGLPDFQDASIVIWLYTACKTIFYCAN